jgi:Fe-S cluster biogenesis protein NfuA
MSDSLIRRIEKAIEDEINPKLLEHNGWVELTEVAGETAWLRFRGNCSDCSSIHATLDEIVYPAISKSVPEIKAIEIDEGASPELIAFGMRLLGGKR